MIERWREFWMYSAQGRNWAQSSWFSVQNVPRQQLIFFCSLLPVNLLTDGYPQLSIEFLQTHDVILTPCHSQFGHCDMGNESSFLAGKCWGLWLEHRLCMRTMNLWTSENMSSQQCLHCRRWGVLWVPGCPVAEEVCAHMISLSLRWVDTYFLPTQHWVGILCSWVISMSWLISWPPHLFLGSHFNYKERNP